MEVTTVAVVGGSICGLTTALLLRDAGFDVDVYERSPIPLSGFGNGIVVQPELVRYLIERGATDIDSVSVPSSTMQYVDGSSGVPHGSVAASWRFTAYDTIYRRLLELFGEERYHLGKSFVGLSQEDSSVRLRFADGSQAEASLVAAADGGMSVVRQRLTGVTARYAGYVTWRGLLERTAVSPAVWEFFDDAFTYGLLPDSHLIAYPIPGRDGGDERRLNFQWYWNVPEGPELDELMTDCNGIRLPVSVHSHALCPSQRTALHERSEKLAPAFRDLVQAADQPFVTVVADADVDRTVHDRVVLLGDAAITPRPHAAAGAAKAAWDAWTFADAVNVAADERRSSLARWEARQLSTGRAYLDKVRTMAARLQHGGDFPPGDPAFRFGLPHPA
ncbi:FAD-dependent monooxygenase [Amycolatopsis sp. NPDC059090]|uniref:FAD binding domain-containing protein n=1 Tax=unclassified Amycolatopsis TaxID=2618356 RepID=UPI00366B2C4F